MPYYRQKIIASKSNYKPLKCQDYEAKPSYTWHQGCCIDVSYQAKEIERQYQLSTISESRWNLQLASILQSMTSLFLVIFFSIMYGTTEEDVYVWSTLLYAMAASTIANLTLVVISFTLAHHSISTVSLFTLILGLLPSFVIFHFGRTILHPVYLVLLWSCPILTSYYLLYLPFLLLLTSGTLYSVGLALFAFHEKENNDGINSVWIFVVLFCVNLIGAVVRLYDNLSSRQVFHKIGKSLLYQQQALEETLLKEVLIKSIMPEGVCNEILYSGMLHDVVLCKDPENMMRNLPIKLMEPVSILFADLVGFTAMSSTLEAAELVSLLTDLYGRFDCVAEAYSCENISILGDCYFAVSGCPEADERHADNCMYTGVGLVKATHEFCAERHKTIDIRVGIHTGIVLCGIVGGTKFKYDVWSSDAKIANHMESGGVPGRVHISEQTKSYLKDEWEFEDGFGSRREPELQGMLTFLLKKEFQDTIIIESKKKDVTDSAIYRSICKSRAKQTSVSSIYSVKSEDIHGRYSLLPVLHPIMNVHESNVQLNGPCDKYKNVSAKPSRVLQTIDVAAGLSSNTNNCENSNGIKHSLVEEGLDNIVSFRREMLHAASRSWNIHKTFRQEHEKVGRSFSINPFMAQFRSSTFNSDFFSHGWKNENCACIFSRGFTLLSMLMVFIITVIILVLMISKQANLPILIVNVVVTVLVFGLLLVTAVRWVHVKQLSIFLKKIHSLPYFMLPFTSTILLATGTLTTIGCSWNSGENINIIFSLTLLMSHFLIYERSYWAIQAMLLSIIVGISIGYLFNNISQTGVFSIAALACSYLTVLILSWVKCLKGVLRFGTLLECNTELAVTKEEENVTTQLFNTIIPKHVSEQFLTELNYSHSYDYVGVIFASVTNFWDFYEEKFEGGMGCIRILNEIVRDLDDLLLTFDSNLKKVDPRWAAIQKIKTVGSCYMAASGLDPITEEQTRQGNHQHIIHLMEFCFEILKTIKDFNDYTFGTNFTMKIGFNYGPVTDGIIGKNKVLYDIWGDTVNLASRMMSTGVVGRIQVPTACVPFLIDHFKIPKRGKVPVKGKGDVITHFCIEKKPAEQIKANLAASAANKLNASDV